MRLVCISDTHSLHAGVALPEGDILVHAGDVCNEGTFREAAEFFRWFGAIGQYRERVLIAGNHDLVFEDNPGAMLGLVPDSVTYLNDSGAMVGGLKFWGSPVTPYFFDWAFNRHEHQIGPHWDMIPAETEVLVTHGPPLGVLDRVQSGEQVGCPLLLRRVQQIRPKVHLFGHIHEGYGEVDQDETRFVNASVCTLNYEPNNLPIVVDLE